ncbi:hypothetical protein [Bordetella sp. BOR01]|uniref:hypothetical protein n=1 Tax=Bordetella sp. BOR01 TaxID=2854779 RepID=UPI001C4775C6|nr:hypothetical protein [Bordetella sp. BOR01]MBV7482503.1 hypothetical protein [Bordetella sp. BOR01]
MIVQKQAYRHRPEQGVFGDCHRTAIACILDLPRDEVPNFGEHYGNPEAFRAAERHFLASRGLATVNVVFMRSLEQVLTTMGATNPDAYYLLAGTSRSGCGHSVVGLGDQIVWDPSLDDSGIVGPMDDGFYWISYLVPLSTTRRAA